MASLITCKILDNTVISACINNFNSVDLLAACRKRYEMATSKEIYQETEIGYERGILNLVYREIFVIDQTRDAIYQRLITFLKNRYPYLHEGELSIFLLSLMKFHSKGKRYYLISDDKRFRSKISEMISQPLLVSALGKLANGFKQTGTIGLIRQLFETRCLSPEEMADIIRGLEKGRTTFYISDTLINELRKCIE
jgi:hypothetical protein